MSNEKSESITVTDNDKIQERIKLFTKNLPSCKEDIKSDENGEIE